MKKNGKSSVSKKLAKRLYLFSPLAVFMVLFTGAWMAFLLGKDALFAPTLIITLVLMGVMTITWYASGQYRTDMRRTPEQHIVSNTNMMVGVTLHHLISLAIALVLRLILGGPATIDGMPLWYFIGGFFLLVEGAIFIAGAIGICAGLAKDRGMKAEAGQGG